MTEEAIYELLEEARQACGRSALKLASFLGARIPNADVETRRFVTDAIQKFTGKRAELAEHSALAAYVGDQLRETTSIDDVVTQAGGCSWCRSHEILIGGVVASWAFDRKLFVCRACASRGVEELESFLCQVCGLPIAVGEWGCITTIRPHGKSVQTHAFVAYFDYGLGKEITSLGDRHSAMRPEGTQVARDRSGQVVAEAEGRGRLEYRDLPKRGDLSARREREHQRQQEQRRQERGCVSERDVSEVSHPDTFIVYDDRPPVLYDARRRPLQRKIGFR